MSGAVKVALYLVERIQHLELEKDELATEVAELKRELAMHKEWPPEVEPAPVHIGSKTLDHIVAGPLTIAPLNAVLDHIQAALGSRCDAHIEWERDSNVYRLDVRHRAPVTTTMRYTPNDIERIASGQLSIAPDLASILKHIESAP